MGIFMPKNEWSRHKYWFLIGLATKFTIISVNVTNKLTCTHYILSFDQQFDFQKWGGGIY